MIIVRYLTKEICSVLLAATFILLLIVIGNQFVYYLKAAAAGRITAHAVLLILSLKMPQLLALLLPMSLFLAILLVCGRMYAENEMTVLFACGVSQAKLSKIIMTIAVFVTVIVALLMFWVTPQVNKYMEDLLSKGALSPLELVVPGRFQSVVNSNWIFYVENTSRDHKKLYNVFAAQQPNVNVGSNAKGQAVLIAKSGYQKIDKKTGDLFLVFNKGNRYSGVPGQKKYQLVNFDKYGIRIAENQRTTKIKENSMSTSKLWHNRANNKIAAELQWRISIPIMTLILAFMSIPLSRVKTRRDRYAQLVPAVLLYVVYGNFMFLGRSWMRDGKVSHIVGMWWVHEVMLLIAILLIIWQVGWRRFYKAFVR